MQHWQFTFRAVRPALLAVSLIGFSLSAPAGAVEVPRFGVCEETFQHQGRYENPYAAVEATARLVDPDGRTRRRLPLFWDGQSTWKFRFSPDQPGAWSWKVTSNDPGLDGRSGTFQVVPSDRKGSIRPMAGFPHHFQRDSGSPFWFMGDTGWALYTDDQKERHTRRPVTHYIDTRAAGGFNVIHSMLLSEAGWGNRGGPPFLDLEAERINPAYWREVDERLTYLNGRGIIGGLVLAWGDKRRQEPYAWRRFPSLDARRRYARYIAARYSAFDVYFVVAGEWHAEVRTRRDATESSVKKEFIEIGNVLHHADPHNRMVAIHPMTRHGSVREFVGTPWMRFGDYQQNYRQLHDRVLQSRRLRLPVVNSEYAYFLRDSNGDGLVDKPNSLDVDVIRHATWDIVMAGGYFVTGFGTTYFGGHRDPGPFDVDAAKNDVWEEQVQHVRRLLTALPWWKLQPADDRIASPVARSDDRTRRATQNRRSVTVTAPPETTYWMLAHQGHAYVAYVRGCDRPVEVDLGDSGRYRLRQFDPRTGRFDLLGDRDIAGRYSYQPPDDRDWVLLIERAS